MKEQLDSLYEYGEWATQRLLASVAACTEAQFKQKVLPSFGSVHLTLAHVLGAEFLWLARSQGNSPKTMLSPDELSTVSTMHEHWAELIDQRHAYFATLGEADLETMVHWTNMRGQSFTLPRWQVMLHCANHSTHHRSEVAAILTELGHEPESTDLLEFFLERAGQYWKPSTRV